MFVGLVELMLEFVKPVTLSMRLFGNIYGGEVALGVLTALTIFLIPVAMYSLELLLNLVQALIFSILTLMYTVQAIETHHDEGHAAEEAVHEVEADVRSGGEPVAA
jgi:F-type H+-transporting ATPase subunit a